MKHDLNAIGRYIFPTLGISIIVSAFIRLFIAVSDYLWAPLETILAALAILLGVLVFFALFCLVFIIPVIHFYQAFASRQAYLTFSIPTSIDKLLISHALSSAVYTILGGICSILCLFIIIPNSISGIIDFFSYLSSKQVLGTILTFLLVLVLFYIISAIFSQIQLYFCIAFGTQFTNHKIAGSILGYFILSTVSSILSTIVSFPFNWTIFSTINFYSLDELLSSFYYLLLFSFISSLIITATCYFINRYLFTKRINLT